MLTSFSLLGADFLFLIDFNSPPQEGCLAVAERKRTGRVQINYCSRRSVLRIIQSTSLPATPALPPKGELAFVGNLYHSWQESLSCIMFWNNGYSNRPVLRATFHHISEYIGRAPILSHGFI